MQLPHLFAAVLIAMVAFSQAKSPSFISEKQMKQTFFELEGKDIDGKTIDFERFYGYVTVVLDIGDDTQCETIEKNLRELFKLHKIYPYALEFVVLPSSMPHDTCSVMKEFAADEGVNFLMLEPGDVNDDDTHPVYAYLKGLFGLKEIKPNFSTYFIISPEGAVEVVYDVSPIQLKEKLHFQLKMLEMKDL